MEPKSGREQLRADALNVDDDLAALKPLDLSMVPSCPNDSAAAMASLMESANIDPAWLWSSLDVYA
jgi:hypothetical protein